MSLDTKQKRGSAISVSLPWRAWVSDPSGISEFADRLSFVHYASASGGAEYGGIRTCGILSVRPRLTGTCRIEPKLSGTASVSPRLSGNASIDCNCGDCE